MKELADNLIAQWGAVGLLLAALVWALVRSEKENEALRGELKAEHTARLDDAKKNAEAMLAMSDKVHSTVDKLADIAERLTTPKS